MKGFSRDLEETMRIEEAEKQYRLQQKQNKYKGHVDNCLDEVKFGTRATPPKKHSLHDLLNNNDNNNDNDNNNNNNSNKAKLSRSSTQPLCSQFNNSNSTTSSPIVSRKVLTPKELHEKQKQQQRQQHQHQQRHISEKEERERQLVKSLETAPMPKIQSICEKYNIVYSEQDNKKALVVKIILHMNSLKQKVQQHQQNTPRRT
eukprot:Pgem_evm1s3839